MPEEALAETRARGDGHGIAFALRGLARLRRADGEGDQAPALLRESLTLREPLGHVRCSQMCLEDLAGIVSEPGTRILALPLGCPALAGCAGQG